MARGGRVGSEVATIGQSDRCNYAPQSDGECPSIRQEGCPRRRRSEDDRGAENVTRVHEYRHHSM